MRLKVVETGTENNPYVMIFSNTDKYDKGKIVERSAAFEHGYMSYTPAQARRLAEWLNKAADEMDKGGE